MELKWSQETDRNECHFVRGQGWKSQKVARKERTALTTFTQRSLANTWRNFKTTKTFDPVTCYCSGEGYPPSREEGLPAEPMTFTQPIAAAHHQPTVHMRPESTSRLQVHEGTQLHPAQSDKYRMLSYINGCNITPPSKGCSDIMSCPNSKANH